jgi:hypothetical protein
MAGRSPKEKLRRIPRDLAILPRFFVAATSAAVKDLKQIASGANEYARKGSLTAAISKRIYSVTVKAAIDALSADDPDDQVTGSVIMMGWSYATSLFTGWATVGFILFWSIFFWWGVARWSDDGERAWDWLTPDISLSMPSLGLPKNKKFSVRRRRKK